MTSSLQIHDSSMMVFSFFLSAMTTDDRSTLSDDDEGISSDDMDEEDISRRAIIRALMVRLISIVLFFSFEF